DGGRFAVGADHVDGVEVALGVTELHKQLPDPVEPELHPHHLERVDVVARRHGGHRSARRRLRSAPSASKRRTFSRSASTSSTGARAVKRSLASLAWARSSSAIASASLLSSCDALASATAEAAGAAASTVTTALFGSSERN